MYDAGKSDREIAEALGISRNAVYHWRFVQKLPSNTRKAEKRKEPEPKAAPPPISPLVEPPGSSEDPMELSVKLDDGKFECLIRTPNLEGARQIYQLVGRLLDKITEMEEKGDA